MPLDAKAVQKPAKKLSKVLKNVSREPSLDEVHDLRTNTRRLEATLTALSLHRSGHGRRALNDLSRIRKRAGKVRDMDVLTGFAASLNAGADSECKVQLLEYLGARRRKLAEKLHTRIAKDRAGLRKQLKRIKRDLDRLLEPSDRHKPSDGGAPQAAATALRLQAELATNPRHLGRQNLHPYRLKVKELRNVLRMAPQHGDSEFVDTLGRVKDAIGEWHDWVDLMGTAEKVLKHAPRCELLRELNERCTENYDSALRAAEDLRRRYLRVSRDGRKITGNLPAKSVSNAIADIAA